MTNQELFSKISNAIPPISIIFAELINELTYKLMMEESNEQEVHEELDEDTYNKMSKIETSLFNSFANLIKVKEALGEELDFGEVMLKIQYDNEMAEAMEMYREFKNTEEILNDDNKEK